MKAAKYYQLVENPESDSAELYIFGEITAYPWREKDKDAWSIIKDLQAVEARNINVHINSMGGQVSEGLAIYNTLKNSGKTITTICDGFACSAASVIFTAGSRRIMNDASLLMIHNAWTWAEGDAAALRKAADDVETVTQASIEAYKAVMTIDETKLHELMDEETWILPKDAVDMGFATEIAESEPDGMSQSAMSLVISQLTARQEDDGVTLEDLSAKLDTMQEGIDSLREDVAAIKTTLEGDDGNDDGDGNDDDDQQKSWSKFFQ